MKANDLDPLYLIFERNLLDFQGTPSNRKEFVDKVVKDYILYLRKLSLAVPSNLELAISEELAVQVNRMLFKKIYGCLSIDEYRRNMKPVEVKQAKKRVALLKNTAAIRRPAKLKAG